ncbi:MAG: sialidase family protein [Candidatus Eisenbacteria bacterium]
MKPGARIGFVLAGAAGLCAALALAVEPPAFRPLPTPAGDHAAEPVLTQAPDGTPLLSWIEGASGARARLRWSRWRRGGWTAAATVLEDDSLFVNWADVPAVQAGAGDTLVAHVLRRTASGTYDYAVCVTRSTDGGRRWSPLRPVHGGAPRGEHGFVSVLPWPSGGFGYVWLDGRVMAADPDHGSMMLRHTVLATGGEPGPESLLDARTCECCQTGAARTAHGVLVVYRDRSEHEVRDIFAVRWQDGRWTDPAPVAPDGWVVEGCPVNGPAVAARGERAVVAWATGAADSMRVHAATSDDGGEHFGVPVRVDEGDPVGRADVAMLPDGDAAVMWIEGTHDHARIRVRRWAASGVLGAPVTVSGTSPARRSGFPRLVCVGDTLIAAWTEPATRLRVRTAFLPAAALPH